MNRRPLHVDRDGTSLGGWVEGDGPRVLLLHGGPGLSYGYLDGLAEELLPDHTVAAHQQRGLPPSRLEGPFAVSDHIEDVRRVLDELGWDRADVVGHSWGGHLALHVVSTLPDRVSAALCVDPLGGVGDGGEAEFGAELDRRTPAEVRQQAAELDARAMRGEGTEADAELSLRLAWPAYFPSRKAAPPMPEIRFSVSAYAETFESVHRELPRLEQALPSMTARVGFVVGGASPMPATASTDTAARIPGAWVEVVDGAGHFPWLDAPGSVRSALDRLTGREASTTPG